MSAAGSIEQALRGFAPALPLAVAFSGGADSTALLLACQQRWPGQVAAIHVHHGLQAAADDFAQFCRGLCAEHDVPLEVVHCQARHARGQSPEDAARKARYRALAAGAHALTARLQRPVASIALAQHADDQVETLLLALSRGAGLPGLAAMPGCWRRDGFDWYRPLLQVPGQALRSWLVERGQAWMEDPTNADLAYTRNRIRHHVLPALQAAFPTFRTTFARSSQHAAQAQALLQEVAQQDAQHSGLPPRIAALQQLSPARQANLLRYWLHGMHGVTPSAAQLRELQRQLAACTTRGHAIDLKVADGHVQRQGAHLLWIK